MRVGFDAGLVLACCLGSAAGTATAQVVERDVTVTGPRGRTIERQITTERRPGMVERDVTIRRPGGTYQSETLIRRAPGFGGPPPMRGGFVGGGYGPRPYWRPGFAVGVPFFGFTVGAPLFAPPPPLIVPPPVVISPSVVIGGRPAVVAAPQPAAPAVPDPVADALGRLHSLHSNSRRDGALTLGRLGDVRAVPPLIDRLKNDTEKEVRVAAAWALGEIGDPRAAVALQRASLFDRRTDVRNAAVRAYDRLPREQVVTDPALAAPPSGSSTAAPVTAQRSARPPVQTSSARPAPTRSETPPPPPMPDPDLPGFDSSPR